MDINDITKMLSSGAASDFLNTFIATVLNKGTQPQVIANKGAGIRPMERRGVDPNVLIINQYPNPQDVKTPKADLDLGSSIFGSTQCAECRKRQAESGVMNFVDPCKNVCGGYGNVGPILN